MTDTTNNNFTVAELIAEFKRISTDNGMSTDAWDGDELAYDLMHGYAKDIKPFGLDIEHVETIGGGEGDGEHCEGTFKLGDRYFTISGRYQSYDGSSVCLGDIVETEPVEVTKVEYHAIK